MCRAKPPVNTSRGGTTAWLTVCRRGRLEMVCPLRFFRTFPVVGTRTIRQGPREEESSYRDAHCSPSCSRRFGLQAFGVPYLFTAGGVTTGGPEHRAQRGTPRCTPCNSAAYGKATNIDSSYHLRPRPT
ncbi:hypothetical protein GY45DRAFT_1073718 [Cubamyces sp. BRFM 1775]|nr:hypothetical protein GY45DRAFT_1073718 [Cubamyces sp. BRFM 1775]